MRNKKSNPSDFNPDPELIRELERWILSGKGESVIKAEIEDRLASYVPDPSRTDYDPEASYNQVSSAVPSRSLSQQFPPPRVKKHLRRLRRWTSVAAVAVLVVAGIWISVRNMESGPEPVIGRITADVRLILPDGTEIILDNTTADSRIVRHGDVDIVRENGILVHKKESETEVPVKELKWGEIRVPRGALFDLILEDGTHVWLNADSRLRFPIEFVGGERRVYVEGEAYFAVAPEDSKPFIVETHNQFLTVMGTEFNIYSYAREEISATTLASGSVRLKSKVNDHEITLSPGDRAGHSSASGTYEIRKVDAREYTAWKEGMFSLEDNNLSLVFRKLSRWYDFEYRFDDPGAENLVVAGNIPIYDNLQDVLEIINQFGLARIEQKGNTITISMNK